MARLHHENIIEVLDFAFTQNEEPYMVLEFVEAVSLARLLDKRRFLPGAEAIDIFIKICAGLGHAHSAGVIHRDLKPGNILLSEEPSRERMVKIVDFGLAREVRLSRDQELTRTGVIMGSPLYMSPEQVESKDTDERSDIYSMGCLIFKTLTGEPVFSGDNLVSTMMMHLNEAPRTLRQAAPDLDSGDILEPIVARALAKDPGSRYQSVDELRADLELAARDSEIAGLDRRSEKSEEIQLSMATVLPPSKAGLRTRTAAVIAAALLALAGLCMINIKPAPESKPLKDHQMQGLRSGDEILGHVEGKWEDHSDGKFWEIVSLGGTARQINEAVENCPDTERLLLGNLDSDTLVCLDKLPAGLKVLCLHQCMSGDQALEAIPASDTLETLSLRSCYGLEAAGLRSLSPERFPNLKELIIANSSVTDKAFQAVGSIKGLKKIVIHRCDSFEGKTLGALKDFRELDYLELSNNSNLKEANLAHLIGLKIKNLNLYKYTGLTGKSIPILVKIRPGELQVIDTSLDAPSLKALRKALPTVNCLEN
ncbi:MAG: protein kinase [Candidatus Melainabacteria bacterium]|nr:protein kinase [Candidatus Melainabacteria bacterium]